MKGYRVRQPIERHQKNGHVVFFISPVCKASRIEKIHKGVGKLLTVLKQNSKIKSPELKLGIFEDGNEKIRGNQRKGDQSPQPIEAGIKIFV
jgi:hypothetical protein